MRGSVEVQSSARRSYRAVVIPTDALLTFGILKLTSLMLAVDGDGQGSKRFFGVWYGTGGIIQGPKLSRWCGDLKPDYRESGQIRKVITRKDAKSNDDEDKPLDGGLAKEKRVGQNLEVIVTVRDAVERIDAGLLVSAFRQGNVFQGPKTRFRRYTDKEFCTATVMEKNSKVKWRIC
jgi:hypothetical protein